jgi:hypothetical protein
MSPGQKKRLRRIQLRATRELKDALASGAVTPRKADTLLYLSPSAQQTELARILQDRARTVLRCKVAAQTIQQHLDAGAQDLRKLQRDLRTALAAAPTLY